MVVGFLLHVRCLYVFIIVANRNKFQKKREKRKRMGWWTKKAIWLSNSFFFLRKSNFCSQSILLYFIICSGTHSNIMSIKECFVMLLDLIIFHIVPGFNAREIVNVCMVGCTLKLAFWGMDPASTKNSGFNFYTCPCDKGCVGHHTSSPSLFCDKPQIPVSGVSLFIGK